MDLDPIGELSVDIGKGSVITLGVGAEFGIDEVVAIGLVGVTVLLHPISATTIRVARKNEAPRSEIELPPEGLSILISLNLPLFNEVLLENPILSVR